MSTRRPHARRSCSRCHRAGHNARTCPRRNPWPLDLLLKPAITAAAGHLGTETAKGALARARRLGRKRR